MASFHPGQDIIRRTRQVDFMQHASLMLPDANLLPICPTPAVLSLLIFHE